MAELFVNQTLVVMRNGLDVCTVLQLCTYRYTVLHVLIVCGADVLLVVTDVNSLLKSLSASSAVASIQSVS